MSKKPRVLYLSYDGMTDPLGQSQVLAYQKQLSQKGFSVTVMSFDKPDMYAAHKADVEASIKDYDINWVSLPYHKDPPIVSTLLDLKAGWNKIKELQKEIPFDIVHCRGYITPVLGRKMKKQFGTKFLFDMRGWWADEKLESGFWNSPVYKPVYKYFKHLEERFFKESDLSISLTFAGQDEAVNLGYKSKDNVGVIPTCVDFRVFPEFNEQIRQEVRQELNIAPDAKVLLYSGSLGGNYGTDILFDMFKALLKDEPKAILLILSRTDKAYIHAEMAAHGLPETAVRIASTNYNGVHRYLMAGDVGSVIYKKTYSVIGRSPTKLGEYWACGLPAIALADIGDLNYLMERYPKGGTLIPELTEEAYRDAFKRIWQADVPKGVLREYAVDYYALEQGVENYKKIYERLLAL